MPFCTICLARQAYAHACRTLFVGPSLRWDWSIRNGAGLNGSVYWDDNHLGWSRYGLEGRARTRHLLSGSAVRNNTGVSCTTLCVSKQDIPKFYRKRGVKIYVQNCVIGFLPFLSHYWKVKLCLEVGKHVLRGGGKSSNQNGTAECHTFFVRILFYCLCPSVTNSNLCACRKGTQPCVLPGNK